MTTTKDHPTGQETTRELLDLRRSRVRERRIRQASLLSGLILPVIEQPVQESIDSDIYPRTA